jgi:hypothetical protein
LNDDQFCWKIKFEADCWSEGKLNSGAVCVGFFPELNNRKLDNSPSFPSVTYAASLDQWFRCYVILRIDKTAETILDSTTVWAKQNSED